MKPPVFNPEWSEEVQMLYRHDVQEIWDFSIAKHIWNQYHNQLDLYLSLVEKYKPSNILDIGCAQGTLALLLAEKGYKVWAVDIRKQFLDYAASRYERGEVHFICGNAIEIDFKEKFDLIFANQILEHLVYPLEFVGHIRKWLNLGGRIVATTPNASYIKTMAPSFTALGDPSRYEHLQFTADADGHFFAYTHQELKNIFQRAGLIRIKLAFFETPWISGHMKIRYLHDFFPNKLLRFFDRVTLSMPFVGKQFAHQLLVTGQSPL